MIAFGERHPGNPRSRSVYEGAATSLGRYTHLLEGELERARDQLDAFLVERGLT
jgi:hypothetical protein